MHPQKLVLNFAAGKCFGGSRNKQAFICLGLGPWCGSRVGGVEGRSSIPKRCSNSIHSSRGILGQARALPTLPPLCSFPFDLSEHVRTVVLLSYFLSLCAVGQSIQVARTTHDGRSDLHPHRSSVLLLFSVMIHGDPRCHEETAMCGYVHRGKLRSYGPIGQQSREVDDSRRFFGSDWLAPSTGCGDGNNQLGAAGANVLLCSVNGVYGKGTSCSSKGYCRNGSRCVLTI